MKTRNLALLAGLAVSAGAQAYVIDTYPNWDGNVTNGWFAIAQSFVVDNTDNVLLNYKFGIDGGSGNLGFEIVPWSLASGPTGAAVYSTNVAWPGSTGDVMISGINTALTPGGTYAAIVDLQGQSGQSVHWMVNNVGNPTGHSSWRDSGGAWQFLGGSGWSTKFRAEFAPVPEPASMIGLGIGLLALARRRRK